YVQVAGWNDKYIRMPQGAAADVQRVVSQGSPEVDFEKVGTYKDRATTKYTQDKSAAVETWGDPEPLPSPGENFYQNLVTDFDASPIRWQIDYSSAGRRLFTLTDGTTDAAAAREPNWYWQSTTREIDVNDSPTGDAATTAGTYGTGRFVTAPDGYRSSMASVVGWSLVSQHYEYNVSNNLFWNARAYWRNPNGGDIGGHANAARSMGAKLAEPRTVAQFSAAGNIAYPGARVGIMHSAGTWRYLSDGQPAFVIFGPRQPDGNGPSVWFWAGAAGSYDDVEAGAGLPGVYEFAPSGYRANVNEWFNDYESQWTSITTDVYDQRLTLTYQWVSNAHDIYGKRERFETVPVDVTVVGEKTVTQWGAAPISEPQTRLVSARSADPKLVQSSEFGAAALQSASSLLIDVGGHAFLRGTLASRHSTLQLTAGGAMVLEGQLPETAPALAEVAFGELVAPAGISVTASSILVKDSARIQVDGSADVRVVGIELTASGAINLSGNVTSPTAVEIAAGTSVLLDSAISATGSLSVTAGMGQSQSGSVVGTFYADLEVLGENSSIALTAGASGGSIQLTDSDLAAARVDLTALSGSVLHGPNGLIDTVQLHLLSSAGVSAQTRAETVEAVVSAAGDIQIRNLRGMRLLADTANGAIEVSAAGSINAERVVALGSSQHN
ncbi:MAG: hypothetical protein WCK86_23630, partial [Planctomycetia bacterium]